MSRRRWAIDRERRNRLAMPVEIGDLLAAWDLARDALAIAADAARKLGHEPFAREAETIADSLEARVTALSNIASDPKRPLKE